MASSSSAVHCVRWCGGAGERTASMSGVHPPAFVSASSDGATASKVRMTLACPPREARCNALSDCAVSDVATAPASSRAFTSLAAPACAAACSSVNPAAACSGVRRGMASPPAARRRMSAAEGAIKHGRGGEDDQVIRENPASRGTETSAEVLVGGGKHTDADNVQMADVDSQVFNSIFRSRQLQRKRLRMVAVTFSISAQDTASDAAKYDRRPRLHANNFGNNFDSNASAYGSDQTSTRRNQSTR